MEGGVEAAGVPALSTWQRAPETGIEGYLQTLSASESVFLSTCCLFLYFADSASY